MTGNLLAKLPPLTRVLMWMVALPLALAAFGGWELSQYPASAPAGMTASDNAQAQHIQDLQALQAQLASRSPHDTVRINGRPTTVVVARAKVKALLDQIKEEQTRQNMATRIVRPAAWTVVVSGLLAALWGVLGIASARHAGGRALRSRDALIAAFARWRGYLQPYLGVLLALITLTFLALTVVRCAVAYDVFTADGRVSSGMVKWQALLVMITAFTAWGAAAAWWRLRQSVQFISEPNDVMGQALTPQQAPGLWQHVRELAARVGTAPPEHMVLGMVESFYVTNHTLRTQPAQQLLEGRTLHLPLTYLSLLRRDEIDAIIAHEMGHFLGEDTAYSMRFVPLYASMEHALHSMTDKGEIPWGSIPAYTFSAYLLESFHGAVNHWSRQRELAADAVSARVASPEAAARALVHVSALAPVVEERLEAIARRPAETGHDLIAMLQEDVRAKPLAPPDLSAEAATTHPFDTHPPTIDRLKALGAPRMPQLAAPDDDALQWVRSLFADSAAVQSALLADFKSAATEYNAETRRHLQAMSDQVKGTVVLHESRALPIGVFAAAAVLGLATLAAAALTGWSQHLVALLIMLTITAALGGLAVLCWKRTQHEVMTLTPDHLLLPGMDQPLSWGAVESLQINLVNSTLSAIFDLTPETPLPTLRHSNMRRTVVKARKHRLIVSAVGTRGLKIEQAAELIDTYLSGWHAREAMQQM
ncbi:M48 family metallopeptidase [Ottowia sp.]|uniref:M48 family metallopeptidase n=1 Tax=Ottowia sp. TaxID=1898956 RepID=UPI003A841517